MNWGLVLSGGAACGLANIGVLEVLADHSIAPEAIAGSSMGAIIAALHATGHSPADMHAVAADLKPLSVIDVGHRPLRGGLHGGLFTQRLEDHLAEFLGDMCIGDCRIPLICVAGRVREPIRWERMLKRGFTDHLLDRVEPHVFGPEVLIMDALRASSAIPVLFAPARVGDHEYIDLVHFGAIPARTLRSQLDPRVVIATDTMPNWNQFEPWLPGSIREFLAAGREQTVDSLAACDLVLRPTLPATALRFDKAAAFAEAGRAEALAHLDRIRELLNPA